MAEDRLGLIEITLERFSDLEEIFTRFQEPDFLALVDRRRSDVVNRTLLERIQKEPVPCFLLAAALEFVERVVQEELLDHYTFTSFELWLNQYSGLSFEENYEVRAKIAGKSVNRSDYRSFFPIATGKIYPGTHFVTAHKSPDLDTTVASFWGWLDAFAARVGDGLHIWNVPGGPPPSTIEMDWLFRDLFGPAVFTHLAKTRTALTLNGNDLMRQEGLCRVGLQNSFADVDHEREQMAVIVVDEEGFYLGDWRSFDVEGVRQVILLFSSCLRWFENQWHLQLISLFAQKELRFSTIEPLFKAFFLRKITDCEPATDFPKKQWNQVDGFIKKVLGIDEGLSTTFENLGIHLGKWVNISFEGYSQVIQKMRVLFDEKEKLLEDRPTLFHFLEQTVASLHDSILKIRQKMDLIEIALKTKQQVFGLPPTSVTVRSEVEEIRSKMGSYVSLTVTYPDAQGRLFPVGAISASTLRNKILGTVSLRDFCNREEMGIASYLEVISVVDHHKSSLTTFSTPLALIADVQSSNSLVAEKTFEINDLYSLAGQTKEQIDEQIQSYQGSRDPVSERLLYRLLERRFALSRQQDHFIHPQREYIEYLQFLHAILDDTDLLSKVSAFDLECVATLLNRLKSIILKKEVEVVSLEDIPKGASFTKKAAARILQNEEMYSIYRKVYAFREEEVEKNLGLAAKKRPSNAFSDTKEQNGCCLVGQTKLFANNIPFFEKHKVAIQETFCERAREAHEKKGEVTLHLHMISTIVSADEVYQGLEGAYSHLDELWIWIPEEDEIAVERLKRFLNTFRTAYDYKTNQMKVEFGPGRGEEFALLFSDSFPDLPQQILKKGSPLVTLRFQAGTLNSRKAMIMPYLPSLNT